MCVGVCVGGMGGRGWERVITHQESLTSMYFDDASGKKKVLFHSESL